MELRLGGAAPLPVNQIGQQLRTINKQFAPQKRGIPRFYLRSPTAVNIPPPVLRDIYTSLSPQRRSKPPKARGLAEPAVVNPPIPPALVYTDVLVVKLAPSYGPKQRSVLQKPVVVGEPAPFMARPAIVKLVTPRPPRPLVVIIRPIVVFAQPQALGWVAVQLVRRPQPPLFVVRRPVIVVEAVSFIARPIMIRLVTPRRPKT